MMEKLSTLPLSRRFWAAVIALATVVMKDWIGIDPDTAGAIAAILCTWLVGDSMCKTGGSTETETDIDPETGEKVVTSRITS